jgi:tetratricopeptide (TPR) repeat protein
MLLFLAADSFAQPGQPTTSTATQIKVDGVPAADQFIAAQVAKLGDADPAVRRAAGDALLKIGAPARPAVREAAMGEDPHIADAAQQVLRALPWWAPDDPPPIRQLLEAYGNDTVAEREEVISQLPSLPRFRPALLRLLVDELNEDVCWKIEELLADQPDAQTFSAARRFPPDASRPAALLLSARAWLTPVGTSTTDSQIDRPRALALLQRAVDLETATPSYDDGQLDVAFDQLVASDIEQLHYDQALHLRRLQCKRIGMTRTSFPSPFFELLALHAQFGPLAGLSEDLAENQQYLDQPESLMVLGRIYEQQHQAMMAKVLDDAAMGALLPDPGEERRFTLVDFLMRHGWNDQASLVCRSILTHPSRRPNAIDVNARILLSRQAAAVGDEVDAASQMRKALEDFSASGDDLTIATDPSSPTGDPMKPLRIELAEHDLRVAQARGDDGETNRQVDLLLKLAPADEEATIDLVPVLKSRGNSDDASRMFDSAFAPLKARIDAGDTDPELLNDTAWLCARCGEHLADALDWSNRAVAAAPDTAAYLDTNAEAHYRVGQYAQAVKLETLALKYQPADYFMEGQLKRFTAAATQPSR